MSADIRHVAVVGAGGMGALFGAILAEGGLAVTLVDTDHDHTHRRQGIAPTYEAWIGSGH